MSYQNSGYNNQGDQQHYEDEDEQQYGDEDAGQSGNALVRITNPRLNYLEPVMGNRL
jgi:hypothetical protein